jgi:hypothetical protein
MDVVAEYLRLGLRFDRLEEGFVDAFTGDPALRREVQNEPAPQPSALAARARELLAALPAAGLAPERVEFLSGQLTALELSARKFGGEQIGFVDEISGYFQVRPEFGDQDGYAAVHAELDELLPGDGELFERYAAFRRGDQCPPDRLIAAVGALHSALRDIVRDGYGLPERETVDFEVVTDKPWSGFNYYLGGYRSKVAINADLPQRLAHLPHLIAHESYPGHHTEHCRKERGLVERDGHGEHHIFLVNTPECLMAEGLADLGIAASVGPDWGPWAAEIFADLGLRFEGELAQRVAVAVSRLDPVRQDAALLLHDRHRDESEVVAYLTRWLLTSEDRARQSLRFLSHPLWRAYTSTYIEGYRLLSAWLDARPAGMPLADRFLRLLDEPLTPAAVTRELAASGGLAGEARVWSGVGVEAGQ